jgi:hypothetical protein
MRDADAGEFVLFRLNNKRKFRFVAENVVIEFNNAAAGWPVPKLDVSGNKSLLHEFLDQPRAGEHFKRRRMSRGRARLSSTAFCASNSVTAQPFRAHASADTTPFLSAVAVNMERICRVSSML